MGSLEKKSCVHVNVSLCESHTVRYCVMRVRAGVNRKKSLLHFDMSRRIERYITMDLVISFENLSIHISAAVVEKRTAPCTSRTKTNELRVNIY